EDAVRLRDRIAGLEDVVERLRALGVQRELRACLLVPARRPGFLLAVLVCDGRIAATRTVPVGGGAALEIDAALAAIDPAGPPGDGAFGIVCTFVRRPPPELRVVPLERTAILAALGERVPFAA